MASVDRIKGLSSSLAVKVPVRLATTGPITASGLQTIDGGTVVSGDRVLRKDEVDQTLNGIYEANTSDWQRSPDADGNNDFVDGTLVVVREGTDNAAQIFRLICASSPVIPGTSLLSFTSSIDFASVSPYIHTLFDDPDAATARATLEAAGLGANTFTGDQTLGAGKVLVFEGVTDNAFETTLTAADPTADRTATLPDADALLAATNVVQTAWVPQRTQETAITDGVCNLNAALDFKNTPTGATVLTFTNIPATPTVQKGSLVWVNATNYAVTAHANTKISSTLLATLSATGTYLVSYRTSNGVTYVSATGALA